MRGVLYPELLEEMPTVSSWLRHADAAKQIVRKNYGEASEEELRRGVTEENVLAQLDHLRTHPSGGSRLAGGTIELYGLVSRIHTAEIDAFDAIQGRFVPVAELPEGSELPAATPRRR